MIFFIILYLFCSVGGLTLVKFGSENNNFVLTNSFFNLQLSYTTFLGLCLYIVSFLMWIVIIQKYDLSYIQPITSGLSYILVIGAAIFLFKESISLFQWIGIGLILIGVIFMNINH